MDPAQTTPSTPVASTNPAAAPADQAGAGTPAPVENQPASSGLGAEQQAASSSPPAVPPQPKPMTLTEVIAQRNAERSGQPIEPKPAEPPKDETYTPPQPLEPPAPPKPPEPSDAEKAKLDELEAQQRDQFWELSKTDPEKAAQLLKTLNDVKPPQEQQPKLFKADEHVQQWNEAANHAFHNRGRITLAGLLGGDDVLEQLEIGDTDLTDGITNFIQASIAPQISLILGQYFAPLREKLDHLDHSVNPILSSRLEESIAKESGAAIRETFPAIFQNEEARKHYDATFEKYANTLYPQEYLENPHKYPAEYGRILKGIAQLAADTWVAPSPAPQASEAQPQPAAQPQQAMSPAPQRIVPEHRNHLGQFAQGNPVTLEEANALRAQKLAQTRLA